MLHQFSMFWKTSRFSLGLTRKGAAESGRMMITATTFKRPNAMGDLPESNGTMFFAVAGLAKQYIFGGDTTVHGIQRFVTIRAAKAQLVILAASRSLNHFGKIDVLPASWT